MRKRIISSLLVLCIVMPLLPGPAFAAGGSVTMKMGEKGVLTSDEGGTSYPPSGAVNRVYVWTLENVSGFNASQVLRISYDDSRNCTVTALGLGRAKVSCKVTLTYTSRDPVLGSLPRYETAVGGIWIVDVTGDPCTVTFNPMNGSASWTEDHLAGETVSSPTDIIRSGYELGGWYTDSSLTNRYDFSSMLTGDLTLFAEWLPLRTVTFWSMGERASVCSVAETRTVSEPQEITREGFELDGWYTDEALTRPYSFSTPITGDLNLYAKWLPLWTVSFWSMGNQIAQQSVPSGRTVSPASVDAPRGYAFEGWYTNTAYTRPYNFDSRVAYNLALYAKWRPLDEVTAAFDCADGSDPVSVAIYEGETLDPPAAPGRDGYTFEGWYTSADCSDSSLFNFDEPLSRNLTLYAGWRKAPEPVRVIFDSQGGSYVSSQVVLTGEPAAEPAAPGREGYNFAGWYTSPDCAEKGKWDFSGGAAEDMTLYAKWIPLIYTVTVHITGPNGTNAGSWRDNYYVNYGETMRELGSPKDDEDSFGSYIVEQFQKYVSDYLFVGWESNGAIYDFNRPVTKNLNLSPVWANTASNKGSMSGGVKWVLDNEGVLSFTGEGSTGNPGQTSLYYGGPWGSMENCILSIKVGEGMNRIGESSFQECGKAISASLPESLNGIEDHAFLDCWKLTKVNIPSSVKYIGKGAFKNCYSLQTIEIPNGVTELPDNVFFQCCSLRSITLPDSLTSLGPYALSGSGLQSARVPCDLSGHAFSDCTGLESVELAEGVEAIGESAFDGCTALRTVVIPASVKEIGQRAFDFGSVPNGPVHIFYAGTQVQWEAIDIDGSNDFGNAVVHYNCPGVKTPVLVCFDSMGGTFVQDQFCFPEEPLEQPEPPERANYTFTGWYQDAACMEPWDFAADCISVETTLYAGWEPDKCLVAFSGAGGSQTVSYGQQAEMPAGPVREGAKFNGWYTDEAATTLYLFRSPVTENLTLYPGWLEERKGWEEPAEPVLVVEWAGDTVILQGPAERLGAIRQVWAAAYSPNGQLTDLAIGQLDGVTVTFSKRLAAGWRLFFLDADGVPQSGSLQLSFTN